MTSLDLVTSELPEKCHSLFAEPDHDQILFSKAILLHSENFQSALIEISKMLLKSLQPNFFSNDGGILRQCHALK